MILAHLPVCSLAVEGGFGLNFDLFESNIINLAIVIAGLVWFLPKVLGSVLERRRSAILNDLEEAEQRLQQANAALIVAQEDLANAQTKAERIRIDGVARADAIRLESEQRTVEEMARLKQSAWLISIPRRPVSVISCVGKPLARRSSAPFRSCRASSMSNPRACWSTGPSKPSDKADAAAQFDCLSLRRCSASGG